MPESNPTAAPVTFQRAKARAPIGGTRYAGLSTLSGLAARAAVVAAESLQALGLGGGSVVTSRPPATPLTQQVRPAAPAVVRAEAPPPESGRALTSSFPAAAAVPDRAARPVVTPHESRPPESGSAIASRVAVAVAAVVGTPPLVARSEPPLPEPGRTLQGWGPTAPLTPQVRPGTVVVARAEEPRPPAGGVATLPPPTEALTRQERPPAPVTASAEPPRPDPGAVRSSGVPLVPQPRGAMPVVAAEPGRPQPEAGTALSSSGKPEPLTPQVKPGTRVAAQAEPPRPGEGAVLWLKSPVNAPAGQGGRPGTVVRGDDPRPAEGVARYSSALPPPLTPQVKPPRPAVVPAAEPPPAPGQVLASRPAADSPAGLPRPGVVVALEFVPEGGRATWSVAPGGVGPAGPPPRPLVTPFEELPAGGVALWSRPAPPAAPDTLADLEACYRFDGDLTDSSDAGEDLAAGSPAPSFASPGVLGRYLAGGLATGATGPLVGVAANAQPLGVAFFGRSPTVSATTFASVWWAGGYRVDLVGDGLGGFGVGLVSPFHGGTQFHAPAGELTPGDWRHVAFTRDASGNWVLYVDGLPVASGSTNPAGTTTGFNVQVAAGESAGIDQLLVYGRQLSAAEVLLLYNGGAGLDPTAVAAAARNAALAATDARRVAPALVATDARRAPTLTAARGGEE
jgi:hypothetical protein